MTKDSHAKVDAPNHRNEASTGTTQNTKQVKAQNNDSTSDTGEFTLAQDVLNEEQQSTDEIEQHIDEIGKPEPIFTNVPHMLETNVKYKKKHEKSQQIPPASPRRPTRGFTKVK